ncbi:hypothetical protein M8J77_016077 [Diaphorina citri]|nr:hypothetical protein M8J77_016077 [Diaphorina citri]
MAYVKNVNLLKQFNNKAEMFSSHHQVKQEDPLLINPYVHMMNQYSTGGDSVMGVSVHPTHLSHPMYNNIVPDMQHVPVQPPGHAMLQGSQVSQNTLPPPPLQDYIIQELQPQVSAAPTNAKPVKEKSNARPFECEICFRRFNQKQTLKQHILTHTGQRPFECNICFKTFTQQGALQRHIVIHTGEKPFQCTFCDLSFRQKINLHRHMKLHTGAPKEFQCRICKREFSRKGALLRHEPIHDTERPRLKCSCCNKDFLNKESLMRHEKNQELREKGIKLPKRKLSKNGKIEKILVKCKHCRKLYRRSKSVLTVTSDIMASCCIQCSSYVGEPNPSGIHREVEIFQCELCQAIFQKINSYEKHKQLHSNDRKYECDICHLRFKEKRFIRGHMVTHFDVCEHQCHMCGLNFKYASKLRAHYVTHAAELKDDLTDYVSVFECDQCARCFYQRNQIIRHLKTHAKEAVERKTGQGRRKAGTRNEMSTGAEKGMSGGQEVKSGEIKTEREEVYEPFANLSFEDNAHYDDSNDNGVDSSGENDTAVTNHNEMSEPQEDRSKTHPFFCYICKRSYTKKRSLNRHFQVAHTNYEKFPCEICTKTFQTKNSLKQHYVLHKPHSFNCDQCDKTFNRKDALASHKLIHSDKKSFLCPYCPKSFFQKQSLHTHLIQHKGDKSYECGVCGKCFYEKSTLNRHYLSHSGERKYSCYICNMSFIQKNHLDKHFLRHDEIEKKVRFECEHCEKCFYRKDHYLRHRQSHEENRVLYTCNLCERKFTDKYSLARHVKYKKCVGKEGRGKREGGGRRRKIKEESGEEEEEEEGSADENVVVKTESWVY